MNIDKTLINVEPSYTNGRPSHCPKCGNTESFRKEYMLGMQTGDRICNNCDTCVQNYVIKNGK
ncbi:MAG: hypothetical protein RLZZ139_276 [Cyanobacteriota bacterium]|jgi:hypothetical protein